MKSGKITGHSKITGWGTRDILYLSIQISPKSPFFVTRPRKTGWMSNVNGRTGNATSLNFQQNLMQSKVLQSNAIVVAVMPNCCSTHKAA
jgi:hypothetical protein